jgi:hypothetical protein
MWAGGRPVSRHRIAFALALLLALSCQPLELEPPLPYAWAIYDPGTGRIPTPNQALVDSDEGHVALTVDAETQTPASVAVRQWMNTLDGWSTVSTPKVEFSEPVDPTSVTDATFQVWRWGDEPERLQGLAVEVAEDGLSITVTPPREGWDRTTSYVVLVRGAGSGMRTAAGAPVGPDAAFTYLRLDQPIDGPEHQRAFTGATRAERLETARRLEAVRASIDPYLAFFAGALEPEWDRIPRDEVIALWEFTTTRRIELAMDRESQRVPLPFDLLIEPDTGLVHLSPSEHDSDLEADAKLQANKLDGFGTTTDMWFQFTGPVDPASVTTDTVLLYDLSGAAGVPLPVHVDVMAESGYAACDAEPVDETCRYVFVGLEPESLPLRGASTYALVVTDGVTDLLGEPVVSMSLGRFVMLDEAVLIDGASQLGSLDDEQAARVEGVRVKVDALLDGLGRDGLAAAWPFTTMDVVPLLQETAAIPETLGLHPTPTIDSRMPAYSVFGEDAISDLLPGVGNPGPEVYAGRVDGIAEVVQGTIQMPWFLDPVTRRWREDGGYELVDVPYLATIPDDPPNGDFKVVIFGHAVVTDRRFLLTIGGRLAKEGYAAVAIDFPFHGERTTCVDSSLAALPNFFPEELQELTGFTDPLLYMPPCVSGDEATCSPEGLCIGPDGEPEDFWAFPIMDLQSASGAAFLDVSDISHIPDHYRQAIADLASLRYSLATDPTWSGVYGRDIRTDSFHYVGMSLGSLIGSVWIPFEPSIDRIVLNVAGSNMVDLFLDSTYFGPQIDIFLEELDIEPGTFEAERMLTFASWLVVAVDPLSVAHLYAEQGREGMIQMDKVNDEIGDIIIPNHVTEELQRASGLPMVAYPSFIHVDLIIPLIGNSMLNDAADWLGEDLDL